MASIVANGMMETTGTALSENDRDEANFLQNSIEQCFAVGAMLGEKYLSHLENGEAREGLLEQIQFNYEMVSRFVEKLAAMGAVKVIG